MNADAQQSDFRRWIEDLEAKHQHQMATDPAYRARHEAAARARIEHDRREAETAARLVDLRRRAQLRDRGVPAKDHDRLLADDLAATPALEHARAFYANPTARLLVLGGGVGVGKTVALAWLVAQPPPVPAPARGDDGAEACLRAGQMPVGAFEHEAWFITAAELSRLDRFKSGAMDRLTGCPVLAIDDLGAEYLDKAGAFLALLDELVNVRYSNALHTAISTNCGAASFRARYGERVADRVREVGLFFECGGPSLRGRKATP